MNRSVCFYLLLGLCTLNASNGSAHTKYVVVQPTPAYVIVESEPPAEIVEEIGPCPGSDYIWIKGSWQWDGCRWVRVKGHWALKPHAAAVWVSGCWTKHHHHWQWIDGCWK
jgi:hypothetical protein